MLAERITRCDRSRPTSIGKDLPLPGADTGGVRTPQPYSPDPNTATTRLSYPEVEAVLQSGGRGFVKNTAAVMHFVTRVKITMRLLMDQNTELRGVIERQQRQQIVGSSSTLDPLQAARFLSTAQLEELFNGLKRDGLNRINRRVQSLESAHQTCMTLAAQAQLVIDLAGDELSPATRERLAVAARDLAAHVDTALPARPVEVDPPPQSRPGHEPPAHPSPPAGAEEAPPSADRRTVIPPRPREPEADAPPTAASTSPTSPPPPSEPTETGHELDDLWEDDA